MDQHTVIFISKPDLPHLSVLEELPPSARVVVGDSVEALQSALPEAEVIVNGNFQSQPFQTIFPLAKRLRWVHSLSTGVESTVYPPLIESPIPLTNARGVFRASLAEFSIAAMLHFAKDLRRMLRNQMAGRWEPFDITMLENTTLGVIGYGEIGRASAKLAHAFGMKVLALRRRTAMSQDDPLLDKVYAPDQLRDMLADCDYILIAAPNTPETRGMIGEAEIARMKNTAVIINVGRGPVIVEAALIKALESGRIKGAALDVFDQEPLPEGHPFYRLENVLLSPHCADHTSDWVHLAMQRFVENYRKFDSGQPLDNIVDKKAGY